ncbi:MAG TPA: hypothetical protein VFI41_05165 [Gemmatimonadales bacterium]|nr:hypothetical protein [Gemmatimonadales bacterium]
MRQNRATVKDEGLGAAFKEGLNEGLRLDGYVVLFMKVGKNERQHTIPASEVLEHVSNFIGGLRGEHYEEGVVIRIFGDSDAKSEPDKAQARVVEQTSIGESGIEDAEIVDG